MPPTFEEFTTRRVLTTGWLDGEKLSQSQADDVAQLVNLGVVCYLKQLLDTGFFHVCSPYPLELGCPCISTVACWLCCTSGIDAHTSTQTVIETCWQAGASSLQDHSLLLSSMHDTPIDALLLAQHKSGVVLLLPG